jgi:predicted permease
MILLHRVAAVLRWLLRRKKEEQNLDAELQTFIEHSAADKMRDGTSREEALRLARLELGGIDQVMERVRSNRHGALLDDIVRDVRFASRALTRNPGFAATIVVTLALGIGANTAIFGLIDSLMLRWLPVKNPQELVQITFRPKGLEPPGVSFSYPIVRALANQTEVFSAAGGFSSASFNVGAPGSASRVHGAWVTGGFYAALDLQPAAGRLLEKSDDEPRAAAVAVVSYEYWDRQFSHRPETVGQAILVNGVPVTIVGVSPAGFTGANVGDVADITLPVAAIAQVQPQSAPLLAPGNFWLRILARPRSGLSVAEARARLAVAWPRVSAEVIPPTWPQAQQNALANAVFELTNGGTGWSYLRDMYRRPLWVLMAMVGLVLLIGCANVASMLLARASARQREMAVRLAIGSGRGRIVRQLLMESTLLSLIGAAFGVGLAWLSGRFLLAILSTGPAQVALDLTPNGHVLGFTVAVALATGLLFAIGPALHISAASPSEVLKDDVRMTSRSRLLSSLVTLQVALSLVLLVGAGLFVRTLKNLRDFSPGFNRQSVLLVDFEALRNPIPEDVLDEVQRVENVVCVSMSTHTPLSGATWTDAAVPQGQSLPEDDNAIFVGTAPRFFETMQTPVRTGREFTRHDSGGSAPVAIINEAYAAKFFPDRNPIGEHLSARVRRKANDLEIVGIVSNTYSMSIRTAPYPTVYVPYAQLNADIPTTLEIRSTGSLDRIASGVKTILQRRLPGVPVDTHPLSAQVEATIVQERMIATLATGFGLLALVMSCLGVYGLLAYSVTQRTKEIGIRMALGARSGEVIELVLKNAVRLVLTGVVLGLPAALAASSWLKSALFGLSPADPGAIGSAILLLAAAALIAAYLPARRASKIDPIFALRHE